jgi:hypothetical protein
MDDLSYSYQQVERIVRAVHDICKELGAHNVWFEMFDMGQQLGVAYQNPDTERRWAIRIHKDDNNIAQVIADLKRMTLWGDGGRKGGLEEWWNSRLNQENQS